MGLPDPQVEYNVLAGFYDSKGSATSPSLLLGLISLPYRPLGRVDLLHPLLHLAETLTTGTVPPHS